MIPPQKKFGVSTFIIGITVVAFGTSAPELAVGLISGINHTNQLTLGNIIGSGISNIALIVGFSAIIMPLAVKDSVVKREIPLLIGIEIMLSVLLFVNGSLSRINGAILLAGFIGFMVYIIINSKKSIKIQLDADGDIDIDADGNGIFQDLEVETQKSEKGKMVKLWVLAVLSLVGLFIGGRLTVSSSSQIAKSLGLSETLVGLTVVAFATTLPELVASIIAAIKKEPDIDLGNCIGSNIFNILLILGTSSLIFPITVDNLLWIDVIILVAITLFVFIISAVRRSVRRPTGIILLIIYIAYIIYKVLFTVLI